MKAHGTSDNSALRANWFFSLFVAETGSSFWAILVRPTLRKRLEASPWMVWLIEFIGVSIARNPKNLDCANDLFPELHHSRLAPSPPPNCRFVCRLPDSLLHDNNLSSIKAMRTKQLFYAATAFLGYILGPVFGAWSDKTAGLPWLDYFSAQKLGSENYQWTVAQDKLGRIYVGSLGLIIFDGQTWKTHPIGNSYAVRALQFAAIAALGMRLGAERLVAAPHATPRRRGLSLGYGHGVEPLRSA